MPSLNIRNVPQDFMDMVSQSAAYSGKTKREWVMESLRFYADLESKTRKRFDRLTVITKDNHHGRP